MVSKWQHLVVGPGLSEPSCGPPPWGRAQPHREAGERVLVLAVPLSAPAAAVKACPLSPPLFPHLQSKELPPGQAEGKVGPGHRHFRTRGPGNPAEKRGGVVDTVSWQI